MSTEEKTDRRGFGLRFVLGAMLGGVVDLAVWSEMTGGDVHWSLQRILFVVGGAATWGVIAGFYGGRLQRGVAGWFR